MRDIRMAAASVMPRGVIAIDDDEQFEVADIRVTYIDYSGYPEYPQYHTCFEHAVSIVDLIFKIGPDAPRHMRSFQPA